MADLIGQSIGRYHILEKLGEGGMAIVYKAFDTHLECEVAVKIIRTDQLAPAVLERTIKRFEREAKEVAKLTHPNIVKVMDYGEHDGTPFLVMSYLHGGTLKQKMGKPVSYQEAIKLLLPIARALDYAHQHKMIHRDVKPSNILITDSGEVMLTDFGIAKMLDIEDGNTLTGTGVGLGTPEYMAPEQWVGQFTTAVDIYALGVVLYELITGRKPYTADTPAAVLLKQATEPLPRPRDMIPGLPEGIERVLFKTLAKVPGDRYATMGDLAAALEHSLQPGEAKISEPELRQVEIVPEEIEEDPYLTTDELSSETVLQDVPQEPQEDDLFVVNLGVGVSMEYIRIPAGKFLMGSDPKVDPYAERDEFPQHEVYLDEYWIAKTPVTNEQYLAYAEATNSVTPENWKNGLPKIGKEIHPVVYINFEDVQNFCVWLTKISNRKIRLPSEAEWEKAARGVDGRIYPWGNNDPDKHLAHFNRIFGGVDSVFAHPDGASPYGVNDMAGNVLEWLADWYDANYYQASPTANPSGPATGESRVLRGGSWGSHSLFIRSANRYWANPTDTSSGLGFRCACSLY